MAHGDGWVFAGLAMAWSNLRRDDPQRVRYNRRHRTFQVGGAGIAGRRCVLTAPAQDWTQKKAFNGVAFPKDYAVNY